MSKESMEFQLPNYTTSECSDGPKSGSVVLKELLSVGIMTEMVRSYYH